MAKIAGNNEGIQTLARSKFRRSLKVLQVSADEEGLSRDTMNYLDDKTSLKRKEIRAVENETVAGKENVLAPRRSKRRTAAAEVTYAESPVELKTKSKSKKSMKVKTVTTSKKACATALKQNEGKSVLNQTKFNITSAVSKIKKTRSKVAKKDEQKPSDKQKLIFSPEMNAEANEKSTIPQSSLPDENKPSSSLVKLDDDSGFDPSSELPNQSPMNSTAVVKSSDAKCNSIVPSIDGLSVITCDTPPLSYWRDLAEQRRVALDKALHENELLHDQLTVLEAENSQLKELVREAENLAQALRFQDAIMSFPETPNDRPRDLKTSSTDDYFNFDDQPLSSALVSLNSPAASGSSRAVAKGALT